MNLILALTMLSSCATNTVVSDYCLITVPITFDDLNDTEETRAQILKHNYMYECMCVEGTKLECK